MMVIDMEPKLKNPLNPVPEDLKTVGGISKLKKAIEKELSSRKVSENFLRKNECSNLPHLLSVYKCLRNMDECEDAIAVLKPFPHSNGNTGRLIVDIVCRGGTCWLKVSARNPRSLSLVAAGEGGFGRKTILDHAMDYLDCAKQNECLFKPPEVKFVFATGIAENLAAELESLGIEVLGERISMKDLNFCPRIKAFDAEELERGFPDRKKPDSNGTRDTMNNSAHKPSKVIKNPSLEGIETLNLDISAFLAYCSNLTNGHTNVKFQTPILAQQCAAEIVNPQKPVLDQIFKGRKLICCQTAFDEFKSILETVGGPEEKQRAYKLLQDVSVVQDAMSERTKLLEPSGNRKNRSITIFGTGDALQAVTVTANSGFVRSARTEGIDLQAFVHESRALTEQKEMCALALKPEKTKPMGLDSEQTTMSS